MGQSKTNNAAQVWANDIRLFNYKYGRRIMLFGILVVIAFYIGWFMHKRGYFPNVR